MPFALRTAVLSDAGCVRADNEDSACCIAPTPGTAQARQGVLALVADGMGGHAAGEVASRLAAEAVGERYYRDTGTEPRAALDAALREANRRIHAAARADTALAGMGTTCTALVLRGGYAYAAHVGDSRLYLVRGDAIYRMTEDHSLVMEMVRQGWLTPEQARQHAERNVLTRALGTRPEVEIVNWEQPFPLRPGDRFVLCTDGLHDLVDDDEIKAVALSGEAPEAICAALLELAKSRGGYDNVSIVVVQLDGAGHELA